jgi:hypothetical protein
MEFLVELQIRLGLGVGLSQIELDQVQPSHGTLPEVEAKLQQANADHEALRARLASVPTEPRSRLADTAAGTEVDTDAGHAPESAESSARQSANLRGCKDPQRRIPLKP